MARGRPKKDPFDSISPEYKAAIEGGTEEEIRQKISLVALDEAANKEAKKNDEDLKQQGIIYKMAGAQYKEASKANAQKISYARQMLESRGKL
jgi:hypothetical protein